MKIVVADDLPASALDLLRSEPGWDVDARTGRAPSDLLHDVTGADALIVRSATTVAAPLLAAAGPALKIVARAGAGVDNVDVAAATAAGVLVVNTPGANSISVAEHACALMLALARSIPVADRATKDGKWEKKKFVGSELRGKTLGVVGFGRIGREVALRATAFGMRVVAHDPFIAADVAAALSVSLMSLDELCAIADYLTLHLPSTPGTRHLFGDQRLAHCKRGIRIVNTARGDLIDEGALRRAIEAGIVAGAALDVFESEPPQDWSLARLPQVIATPHIAASTEEAQELVGIETAITVRDFLKHGTVRNAVNFPSLQPDQFQRLQPWVRLAERLGSLTAQLGPARIQAIGIRYYGTLAESRGTDILAPSAVAGVLGPILSGGVSMVNAVAVARDRGIDVIESRSSRAREYTSLLSLKLLTDRGERWVEGTVFEPGGPRLTSIHGLPVEAPLAGTMLIVENDDRPGVVGDVGSILGRHGINIASFALGRGGTTAVGIIAVDGTPGDAANLERAVADIGRAPAIRSVSLVRL
jgi:D-3-phosphoglycerate dehydrogenase